MSFDAHKNLSVASVVTAPSPATSGVTLVVGAGQGARFPAVPFNVTIWPIDMAPDPSTAEVARVTARSTDTLTLVRAQEGTTARAIVAGDFIAATITAKSLTDIESGTNFPLITTGAVSGTTGAFSGAVSAPTGTFTGTVTTPAVASPAAGGVAFYTGATVLVGTMHPSGGFSWGSTTDPGAANIAVSGEVKVLQISASTVNGADTGHLFLCGGGAYDATRGALIGIYGNEAASGGALDILAGEGPAAAISFYTSPGYSMRGRMHPSGGFSWGSNTDPGGPNISVPTGQVFVGTSGLIQFTSCFTGKFHAAGALQVGLSLGVTADVANSSYVLFHNAAGVIQGSIQQATSTTVTYNTTSDARLKTSLGRHTDPEVLRRTVIHEFTWKSDGTYGRGVFAQEAAAVAPFAVSVGSDEVDDQGRLTKPWGVDYSKYVPDLIAGWQSHDHVLEKIHIELRELRSSLRVLEDVRPGELARPTVYQRIRAAMAALFPAWITP